MDWRPPVPQLACPRTRSTATIHIEMADAHGLTLSDEFSLSFHLHFHRLLKWLVALPMLVMVAIPLAGGGFSPHISHIEAGADLPLPKAACLLFCFLYFTPQSSSA